MKPSEPVGSPPPVRRHLVPTGQGIVDWPSILATLPGAKRLVELHGGQFAMPVFDQAWLKSQPYIALPEYAALLQAAAQQKGAEPGDYKDMPARLSAALAMLSSTRQ